MLPKKSSRRLRTSHRFSRSAILILMWLKFESEDWPRWGKLVLTGVLLTALPCAGGDHPFESSLSRLPASMQATTAPDDSDSARQNAIKRLRQRVAQCTGPGKEGTAAQRRGPCNDATNGATPLLARPTLKWKLDRYFGALPSGSIVKDRLFALHCNTTDDPQNGLYAINSKNGKALWRNQNACMGPIGEGDTRRISEANDHTVEVTVERTSSGTAIYRFESRSGRLLDQSSHAPKGRLVQQVGPVWIGYSPGSVGERCTVEAYDSRFKKPLWAIRSVEACVGARPGHFVHDNAIVFTSAAAADPKGPQQRQLHAIALQTGTVLWRHSDQQMAFVTGQKRQRTSDAWPMLADGKVIFRLDGELGWLTSDTEGVSSVSFRALDARTGASVWTTEPISLWLRIPRATRGMKMQNIESQHLVDDMLVVVISGHENRQRELWAYRLKDGEAAWYRAVESPESDSIMPPSVVSAGGVLYWVVGNSVTAFDAQTGTLLWQYADNQQTTLVRKIGANELRATLFVNQSGIPLARCCTVGVDSALYVDSPSGLFKLGAR